MSGSIPPDTAFITVTDGTHVSAAGDYGVGYVYAENLDPDVGESYTLVWSVRTLSMVGEIVTKAHASSAQARLRLPATNRIYHVMLPIVYR
jgi:hypothetical protein